MFLLTASAHGGKRRRDLIVMVPPAFPRPDVLVTTTGVLEIVGAVGLMLAQAGALCGFGSVLPVAGRFPCKRPCGPPAAEYCGAAS